MDKPVCSVIIPAYNAEKYIEATLESVRAQSFPDFECIVVDDCSADGTKELVRWFCGADARFRLLENEKNLKVAGTRNRGVAAARGKYVAFLDSDDLFLPDKLEEQIALAEGEGYAFVCGAYELMDEEGAPLGIVSHAAGRIDRERLIRQNEIGTSTVLLKRELALAHPFSEEYFHEDYACWLDCLTDCGCCFGMDRVLTRYRFMRGTKSRNKLRSARGVYEIYTKRLGFSRIKAAGRLLAYIRLKAQKYAGKSLPRENRVLFDNIIFSLQKAGGISVYWSRLLKDVLADDAFSAEFIEYPGAEENLCRKELRGLLPPPSRKRRLPLSLLRFLDVRKEGKGKTLFHSSYFRVMRGKGVLNVTTVFDFTYAHYYKGFKRWVHIAQQKRAVRKADLIICISNSTKADLLAFMPKAKEKDIRVIPLGYDREVFYPRGGARQDRALFVGSRAHYKNFDLAAEAAAKVPGLKLAVAGPPLTEKEKEFLERLLPGRYEVYEFPPDETVAELYSSSLALLYLSSYEGFGLPVAEAFACGCPVVALNQSSIPEVAGEAGILLDTPDPEAVAGALLRLREDRAFWEETVHRGFLRAKDFCWEACVKATKKAYLDVLKR